MGTNEYLKKVSYFVHNVSSQTSFYILVNQIDCVDAKYTCFAHSVLHLAVLFKFGLAWSLPLSFKNILLYIFMSC